MSKFCPIQNRKVIYLDCLDCEEKKCRQGELKPCQQVLTKPQKNAKAVRNSSQ